MTEPNCRDLRCDDCRQIGCECPKGYVVETLQMPSVRGEVLRGRPSDALLTRVVSRAHSVSGASE